MKEVELIGETIEEIYGKLQNHVGQKICQYVEKNIRYGDILIKIDELSNKDFIGLHMETFGYYPYYPYKDCTIFLCVGEDEVLESFEEMMRRKQREAFRKNCY